MTLKFSDIGIFLCALLPAISSNGLTPPFGSVSFVFLDTDTDNPGITFFDPVLNKLVNGMTGKEVS